MSSPDFRGDFDNIDLGATIRGLCPGQKLFSARYRLERILGRGGMGVVWLAFDEKLEQQTALKFLPEMVRADPSAITELKRETRRSLQLTHAHIVRIYDFVDDALTSAIAMEYVDGQSLSALRAENDGRCFSPEELRRWLEQLCAALAYAHTEARLVHRDLKPANLMIDSTGRLKIADFGVASSISESVSRVTAQQRGAGTLVYMSPQQALGGDPSVADDIYALGATIFELLTSKPPFYHGNIQHQIETIIPPSMTERREKLGLSGAPIPNAWEKAVAASLEKDPKKRPASVREFARMLGLRGPLADSTPPPPRLDAGLYVAPPAPTRPKSLRPLAAMLVVGGLAVGGGGWWFGVEHPRQVAEQLRRDPQAQTRPAAAPNAEPAEQQKAPVNPAAPAASEAAAKAEAERLASARGGLEVTTDPPGATVTIGGLAKTTTPASLPDLRIGTYPMTIDLEGYDPVEKPVEVTENRFTNLGMLKLTRSHGIMQIVTTPAGEDYQIELKSSPVPAEARPDHRGKTPATIEDLPTGLYTVTLKRDGWPEQKSEVAVECGKIAPIKWEFAEGSTQITSDPPGASVIVDGQPVGTTPYPLQAPTGEHEVTLQRLGWPDFAGRVTLAKGTNPDFRWEFATGSAHLATVPAGANFTLHPKNPALDALNAQLKPMEERANAKSAGKTDKTSLKKQIADLKAQIAKAAGAFKPASGKTPAGLKDLPTGAYTVTYSRAGWPDQPVEMVVSKEKVAEAACEFAQGTLDAKSEPAGATVKIGERILGKTPLRIELPTGGYDVQFAQHGWPAITRSVQIAKDASASAQAAFVGGDLEITSDPSGATVSRDGKSIGVTPLLLRNQPPGSYKFALSKSGQKTASVEANVAGGERAQAHATLEQYVSFAGTWVGKVAGSQAMSPTHYTGTLKIHISDDEKSIRLEYHGSNDAGIENPITNTSLTRRGDVVEWRDNAGGNYHVHETGTLDLDGNYSYSAVDGAGPYKGKGGTESGTLHRE